MVKLKCNCCGFEQEFDDNEAAFEAGWDAPPHFTGYIACNLCPAVCVLALSGDPRFKSATHANAHNYWKESGRPEEFNQHCLPDNHWGQDAAQFNQTIAKAKETTTELIDGIFGADKSKIN